MIEYYPFLRSDGKAPLKVIVGIIGIFITILGWIILNASYFPFVIRVIAPKYSNAISALNKMHKKNYILRKGDVGFSEISEIIKENVRGPTVPVITQIKTLTGRGAAMSITPTGTRWRQFFKLEILLSNAEPFTTTVYEFRFKIKKKYLNSYLFEWGAVAFWIGIVVSLIAVFL